MSFSSMKSFNDGNFDNIYKSTKAVLDKTNTLARTKLIPSLDKALDNMLDFNGNGSKDSINIQYSVDDDYVIKDVKPQKQRDGSVDHTRCTFLFEDKDGIEYAIKALTRKK